MNVFPLTSVSSLLTILFPFLLSSLCALAISKLGQRISLVDSPNERSSHAIPTPRGGGLGIWLSFIFAPSFLLTPHPSLFTPHPSLLTLLFLLIGLLGLLEDLFNLPSKLRLAIQLSLSATVVYLFSSPLTPLTSHLTFQPSLLTFFFWIIFITGTTNFYNFMDGINGIAGLTGVVGFGLLAFFSFFVVNDFEVNLLSIVLVAGCLGFLPFNFPRARVFMGDVGSIFMGFVFASFVVKLSSDISIFLCLIMFLCTFYADALVTIYYRWRRGENLTKAHRSHLYQYLSNELGYAHWKVSLIYALAQFLFGTLALYAYTRGLIWQFVLLGVFCFVFVTTYKVIKAIKSVRIS